MFWSNVQYVTACFIAQSPENHSTVLGNLSPVSLHGEEIHKKTNKHQIKNKENLQNSNYDSVQNPLYLRTYIF
jgi:hypothetical protein